MVRIEYNIEVFNEQEYIINNYNEVVEKFIKLKVKDKDLKYAQYIIRKQQNIISLLEEQIKILERRINK